LFHADNDKKETLKDIVKFET